jgi:hypothetical protein
MEISALSSLNDVDWTFELEKGLEEIAVTLGGKKYLLYSLGHPGSDDSDNNIINLYHYFRE